MLADKPTLSALASYLEGNSSNRSLVVTSPEKAVVGELSVPKALTENWVSELARETSPIIPLDNWQPAMATKLIGRMKVIVWTK